MGKAIIRLTEASQGTPINLRKLHDAPVKEGNKLQDRRQKTTDVKLQYGIATV
jgi:hypothetical protein